MQELGGDSAIGPGGPSSVLAGVDGVDSAKAELGPPGITARGTRCAKSWTPNWIAAVEAKESLYGRRICGARLMSGTPCTLSSDHPSGRCRYHGGFDLTGAPPGNRNAVLHNLYSRRLMPCGPHCPVWKSCPLTFSLGKEKVSKEKPILSGAGGTDAPKGKWDGPPADNPNIQHHSWGFGGLAGQNTSPSPPTERSATASFGSTFSSPEEKVDYAQEILALHPAHRPTCPYEQTEYNTAVTDALQRVSRSRISAYTRHIAHMLALAQVMVTRAGLALREAQFTQTMEVTGDNYNLTTTKHSAALTAYEKLERAWRRLLADFERNHNPWGNDEDDAVYELLIQSDYDLDSDAQATQFDPSKSNDPDDWDDADEDDTGDGGAYAADEDEENLVPPNAEQDCVDDPCVELPGGRIRQSEYERQLRDIFPSVRARSP